MTNTFFVQLIDAMSNGILVLPAYSPKFAIKILPVKTPINAFTIIGNFPSKC